MGVIYKITSPSGRIYIGKTNNFSRRLWDYKYRGKKRKSIIHDSIKGYGFDSHSFEILEDCDDELSSEREIFWIKKLNSYFLDNPKGMNMTRGGEKGARSWMHDIVRRKNQSIRYSGDGGTFFGKKHTEETKRIIGKKASIRHLERGTKIPEWAVKKGREKVMKSVICYNNSGVLIAEYESATLAAKLLNISRGSVTDSLKWESWVNGQYTFRYKNENYPLKIEVGKIEVKNVKRPVYLLTDELEIAIEFSCAQEASEFLGVPKTTINRAAQYNKLNPTRLGHVFCYKDEYLPEYNMAV